MRTLPTLGLVLALSTVPAIAQQSGPAAAPAPAPAASGNPDYTALTQQLQTRNKELVDQVNAQKAMVKHNQDLLKEAQRLDASNKKLEQERQQLEQQNAQLTKQREALASGQAAPMNK